MDSHHSIPLSGTRVVLVHGLASTPKEFGLIVHPLRRLGLDVHAIEVPGYSHAASDAHPAWPRWLAATREAIAAAVKGDEPFVLGGLCTGALLALAVAAIDRPQSMRGLVLMSPSFACDGWALPWWYRLRHLAYLLHVDPHFWMGERPPYGLKNERLRRWVRQQLDAGEETVAGPPRVSLRAVRESERLARSARQWMKALDTPTLVLHAREDEICSLHAVQSVLAGLPAEHIELCVLENSYHMITADDDRQLVAQRLAAHARACLAAQEGPVPAEVGNGP